MQVNNILNYYDHNNNYMKFDTFYLSSSNAHVYKNGHFLKTQYPLWRDHDKITEIYNHCTLYIGMLLLAV